MLGGILLALAASTNLVDAMSLVPRQAQSQAICQSSYQWMNNNGGDTPCQVAAKLGGICNSGRWIIKPLLDANGTSYYYDNPSVAARTANFCTCSWSYYNLLSACTACQGAEDKVEFWPSFKSGCSGLESLTYFPSNFSLPSSTTIPFWAGTDPTDWSNQRFDVIKAQQVNNQGHSDLGTSPPPPEKKTNNIGAIVGGVVGGIVVIGVAIAIAIFILRRNKKKQQQRQPPINQMQYADSVFEPTHGRTLSGATQKSGVSGGSTHHVFSSFTTTPMFTNASSNPTVSTHFTSSAQTTPFQSYAGGTVSPPPPAQIISRQQTPIPREQVVEPYTLPPNSQEFSDRKHPGGPGMVYDRVDAPPLHGPTITMEIPSSSTPQRTRFNPPAYTETSPESSSGALSQAASRHLHSKKDSADTHHSFANGVSRAQSPPITLGPPPLSLSVHNLNSTSSPTRERPSHGRHLSGPSRDEKPQSPQSDSFYGPDLA